jgi:23S rRNA pseudouridine2605 synthase
MPSADRRRDQPARTQPAKTASNGNTGHTGNTGNTARTAKKPVGVRADGTPRRSPRRESAPRRTAGSESAQRATTGTGRAPARTPASSSWADRPRPAAAPARTPRRATEPTPAGGPERLQKVLAAAGIGSRRASEELIAAGRVTVDGRIAELGDRADPVSSVIHVDGERIVTDTRRLYLAINKPAGVVSTMADEKGRAALADYLGNVPQRVYHVGRLDQDSEGLLLLTNDGPLAHKLMHPSYEVPKTYLAEVAGPVRPGLRRRLMEGVELEDGPVSVDSFRTIEEAGGRVLVEIVLHEGRKHIVRRLLAEVGHPVRRLIRTAIGPIRLGDLKSGRTRRLGRGEVAALFAAVGE